METQGKGSVLRTGACRLVGAAIGPSLTANCCSSGVGRACSNAGTAGQHAVLCISLFVPAACSALFRPPRCSADPRLAQPHMPCPSQCTAQRR